MPNWRAVWALGLLIPLFPSLVLGGGFNKFAPLKKDELSQYSGQQIFEAAHQAYVCSFLMHQAGQAAKGRFLRWYSVNLMQEKKVRDYGKNWNDVNFPGALSGTALSDQYSKRFNVPQSAAARMLLNDDPQCKTLNRFSERALTQQK